MGGGQTASKRRHVVLSILLTPIVVPPINLAVIAFFAVCWRKRAVAIGAMAVLLLLATPLVADAFTSSLETGLSDTPDVAGMQAVLILGGDLTRDSHDTAIPGALTLERLRAGAALARATGLPIAVTGGPLWAGGPPVGRIMADSLTRDFHQPATWVETKSADTWENARDSAAILLPAGIHDVLVVTHAWHMRRSLLAFRNSGLDARPAPLMLGKYSLSSVVPGVSAWQESYYALHEWIGIAWYTLRGLAAP